MRHFTFHSPHLHWHGHSVGWTDAALVAAALAFALLIAAAMLMTAMSGAAPTMFGLPQPVLL